MLWGGGRDYVVIASVIALSLLVYWKNDYIKGPTWCPEVMGFVWGILLYRIKNRFLRILRQMDAEISAVVRDSWYSRAWISKI